VFYLLNLKSVALVWATVL